MGNLSQFFITLGKENRRNAKRQFLNVEGNGGGIQKEEMMDDKTKVKQENERFMELKEMNGKYTCFGKVYGHDLYNLLHLSDSMASSTTLSSATLSSLHTNLQSLDINRNVMVTIDKIEVVKWGTYFTEKNLIVPRPLAQVDHQLTYSQLRQALQMRLQKEKENNPNIHYDNISLIGNETKMDLEQLERKQNIMKKAKKKLHRAAKKRKISSLRYDDDESDDDENENDKEDDDSYHGGRKKHSKRESEKKETKKEKKRSKKSKSHDKEKENENEHEKGRWKEENQNEEEEDKGKVENGEETYHRVKNKQEETKEKDMQLEPK